MAVAGSSISCSIFHLQNGFDPRERGSLNLYAFVRFHIQFDLEINLGSYLKHSLMVEWVLRSLFASTVVELVLKR